MDPIDFQIFRLHDDQIKLFRFNVDLHFSDSRQLYIRKISTTYHLYEENGASVQMPFLKPSLVLQCLLDHYPWLLLGGLQPSRDAQQFLATFWETFKHEHPSHEVYKRENVQFKFTIPIFLHGDGARTLKKQPLEVVSIQAALGLDSIKTEELRCKCDSPACFSGRDLSDSAAFRLNHQHHSYLTHFLLFAFPSKSYKALPGLLKSMLDTISRDMASACINGIMCGGQRYFFAVLGMKGDLEYHAKTGMLLRSYQNVGSVNNIPCCHECLAGAPTVPFEDFGTQASWKTTLYVDPPWQVLPPYHHIPFESWTSGNAARFFKQDPFHVFRLGIARNFIASSIITIALDGYFDSCGDSLAVDARLSRAWASFALWCHTHHVTTSGIRSFSKEKLHFATSKSFPWAGCKGSDTILLLRWLRWFSGLHLHANPRSQKLMLVVRACDSGLAFQGIHRHGIFLEKSCRATIITSCKRFLYCYAELAKISLSENRTLYAMVPKAHSFDHIQYNMAKIPQDSKAVNPGFYDCSQSEDFVGRVARQSRRVSYRNICENVLLAYKVKARLVIGNFQKARKLGLEG